MLNAIYLQSSFVHILHWQFVSFNVLFYMLSALFCGVFPLEILPKFCCRNMYGLKKDFETQIIYCILINSML